MEALARHARVSLSNPLGAQPQNYRPLIFSQRETIFLSGKNAHVLPKKKKVSFINLKCAKTCCILNERPILAIRLSAGLPPDRKTNPTDRMETKSHQYTSTFKGDHKQAQTNHGWSLPADHQQGTGQSNALYDPRRAQDGAC